MNSLINIGFTFLEIISEIELGFKIKKYKFLNLLTFFIGLIQEKYYIKNCIVCVIFVIFDGHMVLIIDSLAHLLKFSFELVFKNKCISLRKRVSYLEADDEEDVVEANSVDLISVFGT